MKCHYEVLGVERDADETSIKKSYRKLALQLHPDKNPDRVEECTQLFHTIQSAYDVLSDKQERAFYDKHREAILKGGDDFVDDSLDLMQYFNAGIYRGFSDDQNSFYTVYRDVFRRISEEDEPYLEGDVIYDVPEFGDSLSAFDEVVKLFYSHWLGYCTKKSYVWKDKYDIRQAPNRPTQRLMEKENRKLRDACRKKRNEEVRALVAFVRKRDKRVIAYRNSLEEKQAEQRRKFEEKREELKKTRNKMLDEYKEQDWMSFDASKLDDIDSHFDEEFGDKSSTKQTCYSDDDHTDSDYERVEHFHCIACDKTFKSEKALANHEKSKKHKENVELIKNEMKDDLLEDLKLSDVDINHQNEDKTNVVYLVDNIDKENSNNMANSNIPPFPRLSSLSLPENIVKLNCIEKTCVVNNGSKIDQGLLNNTTDSLVHAKLQKKSNSKKVKEKKKKGKQMDESEESYFERHGEDFKLIPKDSLYLPRRKSKKQEIHDSADRIRLSHCVGEDGFLKAKIGNSILTDSMRMSRVKLTKADRKKGRRQLLEDASCSSDSSSNDVDDDISVEPTNEDLASIELTSNGIERPEINKSNKKDPEMLETKMEDSKNDVPETTFNLSTTENVAENISIELLNENTIGNNLLSPHLQRSAINDSIRYNKEKMEHHGKNALLQKKFQDIVDADNDNNLIEDDNQEPKELDSSSLHKCSVCNKDYPSRNKLFDHIKAEGHAQYKDSGDKRKKKKSKGKKN